MVWASEKPFSSFSHEYCFITVTLLTAERPVCCLKLFFCVVFGGKKSGSILEPFCQLISARLLRGVFLSNCSFSLAMVGDTKWVWRTFCIADISITSNFNFWPELFTFQTYQVFGDKSIFEIVSPSTGTTDVLRVTLWWLSRLALRASILKNKPRVIEESMSVLQRSVNQTEFFPCKCSQGAACL